MRKITFKTVDKWAKMAEKPLKNELLENFQRSYFGDFRHIYYRFFYHMVKQMKPMVAIELGIDHGHTIVHMAAANSETRVMGIDKDMQCADGNIHRQFANCEVHYINSLDGKNSVEYLFNEYGPVGVVFQDSSHHYEESIKEFKIYSEFLAENAIWVVDDVTKDFYDPNFDPPGKGMVEYFEGLPGRKNLYGDLHHGTVMGIILI